MIELSQKTLSIINKLFNENTKEIAKDYLKKDCSDNLPFCYDKPVEIERIQFAAIRVSDGDLNKLLKAINLAQNDWRDLLVAANFATQINSHDIWANSVLK